MKLLLGNLLLPQLPDREFAKPLKRQTVTLTKNEEFIFKLNFYFFQRNWIPRKEILRSKEKERKEQKTEEEDFLIERIQFFVARSKNDRMM